MVVKTKIIRIGNSQGIRIPKTILEQLNAKDQVELRVEDGVLIVDPVKNLRYGWTEAFAHMAESTEDQLLIPDTIENEWDKEEWEW